MTPLVEIEVFDEPQRPPPPRRRVLRAIIVVGFVAIFMVAAVGFVLFLSQLRAYDLRPSQKADGIVVLTGGSSRVADAMELLDKGFGRRLLISGVHPTSTIAEISRSLPDSQHLLTCCVDLDKSAVNTRSNAVGTRRWAQERGFKSLIVVTSNYHMPRALAELSYEMPDLTLYPFAVIGESWRDEPWWASATILRLLLSEYTKYVAVELRVRLSMIGIDLIPDMPSEPTGTGGDQTSALPAKRSDMR